MSICSRCTGNESFDATRNARKPKQLKMYQSIFLQLIEMKSVCLCGSFKFYQVMNKVEEIFVRNHIKCVKPVPFPHEDPRKSRAREDEEIGTKEHIENVKHADTIYVIDKDGYVGRSTSVEIGVAYGLGKRIYAMEKIDDPAVDILVDGVLSPEELVSKAKY